MKQLRYLLLLLIVSACSSINCPVNNVVSSQYVIVGDDGNEYVLTDTLTIKSTKKDGRDTTLLNKMIGKSSFSLPMSQNHPEDVLYFYFDYESDNDIDESVHVIDTVWIKKDDYPHFESVDCNTTFFHTLTNVRYTQNYLDSIVIKNKSVNFDNETIHFYVYTKDDD